MDDLNWNPEDIDCLIFVSQTPDYILPATSCILQERLKLSPNCYAMDISLGCSGWVLWFICISSLISSGFMKKGLLLAGDTTSVTKSAEDKAPTLFLEMLVPLLLLNTLRSDHRYLILEQMGKVMKQLLFLMGIQEFSVKNHLLLKKLNRGSKETGCKVYLTVLLFLLLPLQKLQKA